MCLLFYQVFFKQSEIDVNVFKIRTGTVTYSITATTTGTVESDMTATVNSRVFGVINEVLIDENDIKNEGDVAIRLDRDEINAELELARANHKAAEAQVCSLQGHPLFRTHFNNSKCPASAAQIHVDWLQGHPRSLSQRNNSK